MPVRGMDYMAPRKISDFLRSFLMRFDEQKQRLDCAPATKHLQLCSVRTYNVMYQLYKHNLNMYTYTCMRQLPWRSTWLLVLRLLLITCTIDRTRAYSLQQHTSTMHRYCSPVLPQRLTSFKISTLDMGLSAKG